MKKLNTLYIAAIISLFIGCNKNTPPTDVTLNSINQNFNGIQIDWSQSTDGKFKSYQLYRHLSSDINESIGQLIHESTSSEDNSFTDENFNTLEKYFYRVYVQNKSGLSSGSNIEEITTQSISLISNRSFETGSTAPTDWTLIKNNLNEPLNSIEIDTSKASDGNQCLKFHHNSPSGCWEMWIEQQIPLSDLSPGETYEFSFNYLSNSPLTSNGIGLKISNSGIHIEIPTQNFPGDSIWHTHTAQFTLPSDIGSSNPLLKIHFCIQGVTDWWIDNINIVKI